MPRRALPLLALLLVFTGTAIAVDALFISTDERLTALGEALGKGHSDDRLGTLLEHLDPDQQPVRVQTPDEMAQYGSGEMEALENWLEQSPLGDPGRQGWNLLQQAVKLQGEKQASASITTRSKVASLERTVVYNLVRNEQRWLVRRIRIL